MSLQSRSRRPDPDEGSLQRSARRLDLIGRIADDLAHEIRNPLNSIVINLEVLRRRADTGDTAAVLDRAGVLEAEVHRLDRLIGGLLRLIRPARDNVATTTVDALLEDLTPVLEQLAACARVTLNVRAGEAGIMADAPADALRFALLHLADTAFRVLPEGGVVDIAAGHSDTRVDVRLELRAVNEPAAFDAARLDAAVNAAHELLAPHGGEARSSASGDSLLLRLRRAGSA